MELYSLSRSVNAADLPLDRLANSTQVPEREKVAEVSRQFEALLLRQVLSQAQKPMFKSTLLNGGGATKEIYQDMVAQQLADRISRGGTFGFAQALEKQLVLPGSTEVSEPAAPASKL